MKPILFDFPLPINTPRLFLRQPMVGDGLILNEAVLESFDLLHRYMPWAKYKPSIDDSEEFVRQAAANWILKNNDEPYLSLFIFEKQTNKFIGATGYHNFNWDVPCIETGYWIRSTCSGKGLMTEAINAITQYAFRQLCVKRITITCDIDNLRSKRIPEKLGYTLEGTLKSNRLNPTTNEVSSTLVYSKYNLDGTDDLEVTWD